MKRIGALLALLHYLDEPLIRPRRNLKVNGSSLFGCGSVHFPFLLALWYSTQGAAQWSLAIRHVVHDEAEAKNLVREPTPSCKHKEAHRRDV